ncbi:MAG TPA: acyltransferase [Chitinophagaceae bacterium]|nr:acyltransferase [Chitinophagaceae bacterium]
MLDHEESLRLNILRFPLIVGVVFIHAYPSTVGLTGAEVGVIQPTFIADFARNIISQGIARVAVPLFFLMSGYLFYFGFQWSMKNYAAKLKSRIKTLLIPFLFWNIVTLLVFALAEAIPDTRNFLSGKNISISDFNVFDYFNAIFGFTRLPIAYQFWFIRDLIILAVLSPMIYFLNNVAPLPFIGLALFYWLIGGLSTIPLPAPEAILFYSVGAYIGSKHLSLFHFDKYGAMIIILYLPIVTIDALTIDKQYNFYIHNIGIVLGMLGTLYSTKLVAENDKLKLLFVQLSGASFFVYAAHEPPLRVLRKIFYKMILPESSFTILFLYFIIPASIILLAVVAHRWLVRVAPRFARVVTGRR